MGWATNLNKVRRLIQFIRERLIATKNWIFDNIINTKGGYFVVGLVIGSTLIFIFIVGKPYYQEMSVGYDIATEILIKESTQVVHSTGEQVSANSLSDSGTSSDSVVELIDRYPGKDSIEKIVDAIHFVESNHGKDLSGLHGRCATKGLDNSYSYGKQCYENEQKTKEIVIDWFERKTKEMPLETALCYFGGQGKVSSCEYSQKVINLN